MEVESPAQAAFDAVGVVAQELAEAYEDAAGLVDDLSLHDLFAALAAERGELAQSIARELRSHDELPRDRDPDRSAVRSVLRHARSTLSRQRDVTLLRERERDEDRLAHQIACALAEPDLGVAARAILDRHRERVASSQLRLAQLRAAHTAER